MGFGILLIGYLATYLMSRAGGYGCYPAAIGCILLLYSLTKLAEYESRFKLAFFAAMPVTVCVVYELAASICGLLGVSLPWILSSEAMTVAMAYAKLASDMLLHVALLLAVFKIASDTGLDKIRNASLRNLIIYAAYFIVALAQSFMPSDSSVSLYAFFLSLLLWLVWLVLNTVLFFSCYSKICDDGDQDMSAKQSKLKFINDIRNEYDKREEKAMNENRAYYSNKMRARAEKLREKQVRDQKTNTKSNKKHRNKIGGSHD